MNKLASNSLAQIVTGNHRMASVFEKYHLDFCCKGKRSLEQACNEQNISIDDLLAELEGVTNTHLPVFPFDQLTLSQLIDYIVSTHHAYVKKEAKQLLAYAEKVTSKHSSRHPELLEIFHLTAAIKEEMELHMHKEEAVLFPRIKQLEKFDTKQTDITISVPFLQAPIATMEQEHDHAGLLLAQLRKESNNFTPPADACTTYKLLFASLQAFEIDLHHHVHLENNILFPKAMKLANTLHNQMQN
jgi:regulator of cell morphogenesis and NO signaling